LILYIRHGQTDYNIRNLWMGSIDAKLNHQGRIQAEKAAINLSSIFIKKIYSSPLARAYETSMIIAELQNTLPEIIVLPGLRERCFGELEGTCKNNETRRNLTFYSGVENEDDFKARITESMSNIEEDGTILIVSHSAVFRCMVEQLGYSTNPPTRKIMNCQFVQLA